MCTSGCSIALSSRAVARSAVWVSAGPVFWNKTPICCLQRKRETKMSQEILDLVEKSSLKEQPPQFEIGDTVDVHTKILEGEKNASRSSPAS